MSASNYHRPTKEFYKALPKVELHRHMEGSVRLSTMLEVGRAHGLEIANTNKLRELVQIGDEENYTFENFLSKFQTLRLFYRSPEVIVRVASETVQDAARDNVRYMELRFTPAALSRAESFPLGEVMDWVIDATQKAGRDFGIKINLIASINRHETIEQARQVMRLAAERVGKGIVGLDLAGNEAEFSAINFQGILREAQQAGLHLCIHAGEWGPAFNVAEAIDFLGAERIGHGVRVLEDPQITRKARALKIPFEVCVTSNYQSGVIPSMTVHPLPRMLSLGLNATINTDDPSISQITLSDEYYLVCNDLGVPYPSLRECILAAAQAAFIADEEKMQLITALDQELPRF